MANNPPKPILTRWYIDTRPLTTSTSTLPLLSTLQPADQTAVQKFYHLKDRHMSLASNLLKYLFVHRTARVPWSKIVISRTPDPHRRPFYIHPKTGKGKEDGSVVEPINVEFNVSHQASMVALAGTIIPSPSQTSSKQAEKAAKAKPEVGIDITCVNERAGRNNEVRTLDSLREYIDIFAEVFSAKEIAAMKALHGVPGSTSNQDVVDYGYRLFYTCWALKEAYIKMTGEALLAPWLRELEFGNVVAPAKESGVGVFGEPYEGVKTTLKGNVVDDVRVEVVALEDDYLFATAARGGGIGNESRGESEGQGPWGPFQKLDIERDIEPCATGTCSCLS
ncbi:4'-phosphopantetheinyl transferase family protein [Aspergillus stella-maris]|uniref:4'-phosphopantetheinyl transferase family protein n=1 Tax=Aspergillus stella-maris TaxID=1810926 RepID=UPI003CCD2142